MSTRRSQTREFYPLMESWVLWIGKRYGRNQFDFCHKIEDEVGRKDGRVKCYLGKTALKKLFF